VPKSPEEQELETFLCALPGFRRKEFEHGMSSFTQGEMDEWLKQERENPDAGPADRQEFERLVRRIPALWREHRKRSRKQYGPFARIMLPASPAGRPRKTALAEEAARLKRRGMNYPQIAGELNRQHGEGTTTSEAVRKLLRRQPDKS
jgi:hypothetical protein